MHKRGKTNRGTDGVRGMLVLSLLLSSALSYGAGPKKPTTSKGKESAPSGVLYSTSELSRTRFDCHFVKEDGGGGYEFTPTNFIRCQFTQLAIWLPENAETEARKAVQKVEDEWKDTSSTQKAKMEGELKQWCSQDFKTTMAKGQADAIAAVRKHPMYPAFKTAVESMASTNEITAMCDCGGGIECIKVGAAREARAQAARCTLYTGSYELWFKRNFQGGGWISLEETASCYSTITTSLLPAPDGQGSSYLWNMKTTSVPREGTDSPFCKDVKLEQTVQTWHEWAPFIELPCKQIKFF